MGNVFDRAEKKLTAFDRAEMKSGVFKGEEKTEDFPQWMEKMSQEQSQEDMGMGWALPLAGDIAGSLLAPQKKIATSLPRLAQLGYKGFNLLSRGAGSGVGSMAGEFAQQKLEGEELDPEAIKMQGMLGLGGEVGTSIAMGPLKPLAKPFLNMMSDITVSGVGIKKWARDRIIKKTTQRAEGFVNDIAPDVVKETGEKLDIDDIAMAAKEALDENSVVYNLYGQELKKAVDEGGEIAIDGTRQWMYKKYDRINAPDPVSTKQALINANTPGPTPKLKIAPRRNKFVKEFGWAPNSPEGKTLKAIFEGGATPENIQYLLAGMYKKGKKNIWGDLNPQQRANREKLKGLLIDDIARQSPEAGALKLKADEAFKQIVRFNKIQKIYNSAIREMPSGDKFLNPSKLAKDIRKNKKRIMDEMPEIWPRLQKEAEFYEKMAPNFRPPGKTGASSVMGMMVGPSAATYAMGGWGIPVAESFGAFSAWAYLSPKTRRVLGEIIKGTAKAGVHLGGMPILMPAH